MSCGPLFKQLLRLVPFEATDASNTTLSDCLIVANYRVVGQIMDLTNFPFLSYFLNNSSFQRFFKYIVILLQEFLTVFKSFVNVK